MLFRSGLDLQAMGLTHGAGVEGGDLVVVLVRDDDGLGGVVVFHRQHVLEVHALLLEVVAVERAILAQRGHDQRLAAELPQRVGDVARAAAELAPHVRHQKRDIEDMQLLGEDVLLEAAAEHHDGVEVGGGSIRIHDKALQQKMFSVLGFSEDDARKQFGFLMNAFEYGAPPHGGIAFGFDRLCSLFGGADSIRDFIAFPKNNSGRDVMIDSPSTISSDQLKELGISVHAD